MVAMLVNAIATHTDLLNIGQLRAKRMRRCSNENIDLVQIQIIFFLNCSNELLVGKMVLQLQDALLQDKIDGNKVKDLAKHLHNLLVKADKARTQ